MKKTIVISVVMLVALVGCKKTDKTTCPKEAVEETVVGVYDSRAVALAYWQQEVDGKKRLRGHEELGMEAIDLGVLMHQQVFSHHKPVQALEYIADKLPKVRKDTGIDVLISKWDKEELAKYTNVIGSGWDDDFTTNNPNVVDLTIKLIQIFDLSVTQKEYDEGFGRGKPAPFDTDWKNVTE